MPRGWGFEDDDGLEELYFKLRNLYRHAVNVVRVDRIALQDAVCVAAQQMNITDSTQAFTNKFNSIMGQIQKAKRLREGSWTGKVANFIGKVYPLARVCFGLTN